MKRTIFFMLLILFLFTTTSLAQTGVYYENDEFHFRFMYPQSWKPIPFNVEDGICVLILSPESRSTSLGVYANRIPPMKDPYSPNSIQEYVDFYIKNIQRAYPNAKLNNFSVQKLYGNKTIVISVTIPATDNLPEKAGLAYVVYNENFRYIFSTLCSPQDIQNSQSELNKSFETFKILL